MPLTTGELDRIKAELGDNVLNINQPYIGVAMTYEQVILPYLREGADTTSSTAVEAATDGAYVVLSVASATGIILHERIAVDVDDYLEMATVRSVSGTSVGVILKKAHAGTYPVTVDGGLQKVRECLAAIYETHLKIKEIEPTGATKKVDEIEFYDVKGKSTLTLHEQLLDHWRDELRSALGLTRRSIRQSGGNVCVL